MKTRREITKLKWWGMCNLAVQYFLFLLSPQGWSRQTGDWLQQGATIDVGQKMRERAPRQPSLHPGLTEHFARLYGSITIHSSFTSQQEYSENGMPQSWAKSLHSVVSQQLCCESRSALWDSCAMMDYSFLLLMMSTLPQKPEFWQNLGFTRRT